MAEAVRNAGQVASLGEFATIPGAPSEPTLRKLIAENADFPVAKVGKNGSSYEIPVVKALEWLRLKNERDAAAKREHAEAVRQVAMDFLGEDSASGVHEVGLSADDRLKLLQAEMAAAKLRILRGEYIRKSSVDAAFANVLVVHRRRGDSFAARLGKRVDLPREIIAQIDTLMKMDQEALASEMGKITEQPDVDDDAGADPAV